MRPHHLLLSLLLCAPAAFSQTSVPPAQSPAAPVISQSTAPAAILILRHAEKPAEEDGKERSPDLTAIGYHRAELLPTLFTGASPRFPRPDILFATARSKHSNRPVETITPLSLALNLPIDKDFEDHDTAGLAHEILSGKYAGKTVLICWHHGEIANLVQALGLPPQPRWNDDVFNQIITIRYPGNRPTFTVANQLLLPADNAPAPTPQVIHQ